MTPERWARIERLYHEALACGANKRGSFLADACAGDDALRREVESLLLAHDGGAAFLSTPAVATGIGGRIRIGQVLGPYVISAQIGAGGMGEVYRARDAKLNRDVALKILPTAFALDPDRLARFTREAHVLASLNHPHIAAIYGFEESSGFQALVLELVDGPTLADRLARGPIPRGEALLIAKQIAEALEAAHEKGILHRDLKPANIALTTDGQVKVLDFGLAKALEPASGMQSDITASSALTTPVMTGMGVVLGTAAYMSPEQATGRPVDKRSDIWAFGCVLHEMLIGTRAFEGEAVSDTLASVIAKDPDWTALPADTPAPIRKLLHRCLEKDRKRRLADISDARLEIEEALTATSSDAKPANPATLANRAVPWTVAAVAVAVAGLILVLWAPRRRMAPAPLRLSVELGADASLVTDQGTAAILSPDGGVLAFVAQKGPGGRSQLYIRRLEQLQATALSGTDEARSPFFSPDGRWVAFFAGGTLKKISVTGGAAVTLCDAPNGLGGGTWADDDTITFANRAEGKGLWRVSAAGGKPELLTTAVEGEIYRWPHVLPGGRAVLYTSQAGRFASPNIVVQPLPNGPRKVLLRSGYLYGRYLPSGHLLYMHEGTLFAAPFDLNRLELVGPPVPALEGVAVDAATGAQFAVAANGTLVYLPAPVASEDVPISWMDRAGKTTLLRPTPANWSNPFFALDGQRLAMDIFDGKQVDVWIYDWARDTSSRLTFDASDDREPVWTPDGRRIVFGSTRDTRSAFNLYWQRADHTGEVQRLTDSKNSQYPASWHPSGRFLVFVELSQETGNDLMILPMDGDEASGWKPGKPTVFLNSPFAETYPMFSPDGRWLAYASDESGRNEMYVRPFPGPGGKWQISTGEGAEGGGAFLLQPMWSRARRELFYTTTDDRIMVVPYTVVGDVFRADKPRLWSEARFMRRPRQASIDLHPDGDRFAVATVPQAQIKATQDKVVLIFNFFDELRRIAPATP
jgi:serine/threonine protein kinase/Tol biopolymer transport system component